MKLKVLGSNSKGNCYILTDSNNNRLLLECGVHHLEIKKGLDFDLDNVWGIVSHGHQDHCRSMSHLLGLGIKICASKGTLEETNTIGHHNSVPMDPMKRYRIGPFTVMGFDVQHDTQEPFGFIIKHESMGSMLFMTDSFYTKYRFANIKHFLIEANYSDEIIDSKGYGTTNTFVRNRVLNSHMSIENLVKMLLANDLTNTNNIIITHLSDTNSDERSFAEAIRKTTGKMVKIAVPGLEMNLSLNPF